MGVRLDRRRVALDVHRLTRQASKDRKTLADDQGLFLHATWRLHPVICAFTSELYYQLGPRAIAAEAAPGATIHPQKGARGDDPFARAGLYLVELAHEGNQAVAHEEVEAAARVAQSLLAPGTT